MAQKYQIEGKLRTVSSLVNEARDNGVEISYSSMVYRLKKGERSLAALLSPPDEAFVRRTKTTISKKRQEMAEILANMGPKRHY